MQIWWEEYLSQIRWLIELWLRSVKKEINFLKITKSIYVSNLGTTYFLNIFLNIVKITIIKIITDIIMIGRTISKYNTPNLKKFLKKWWNKFGYVADSNQFFSRLSGFYDCKYVYFDEVFLCVILVYYCSSSWFMILHKTKWTIGIYF